MKKVLFAALMLMALNAMSRPVDVQRARIVAERYFATVKDVTPADWEELYLFAPLSGEGFVIVAGDDCVAPVLAISYKGDFPTTDIPPHVAEWIDEYRRQIVFYRSHGSSSVDWEAALPAPKGNAAVVKGPLLTCTWNQLAPYNAACPTIAGQSTYAGCTAVAMAQVMHYWKHPQRGVGTCTYEHEKAGLLFASFGDSIKWALMPDALTSTSPSEQKNAVADLLWKVGVAVQMDYGVKASYAYLVSNGSVVYYSAERALINYFHYSPSCRQVDAGDYSYEAWCGLLKNEIDNSRPVLYSGASATSGHSFVLDGYMQSPATELAAPMPHFHINWGWGGHYDGYYAVGAFNPVGGGPGSTKENTYNLKNSVLLGVEPDSGYSAQYDTVTVTLTAEPGGTVSGGGTYSAFEDTLLLRAKADDGYIFEHWSDGSTYALRKHLAVKDDSLTASFAPLQGDTLAYCGNNNYGSGYWGTADNYWGIYVPTSSLCDGKVLTGVQLYIIAQTPHYIDIYNGEIDSTNRIASFTWMPDGTSGWTDFCLDTPVSVDATKPLRMIVHADATSWPCAYGRGSGNSHGLLWSSSDKYIKPYNSVKWAPYAWLMRIVLADADAPQSPEPVHYTVVADSDNPQKGFVEGGGTYEAGSTAYLTATPLGNYSFSQWSDGTRDNPYVFVVNADVAMCAMFDSPTAVAETPASLSSVAVENRTVRVQGRGEAALYDALGRQVEPMTALPAEFTVPSAGIYFVRTSESESHQVIIAK